MLPPPRRGRAAAGPLPSPRHRPRSLLSFHPLMPAAGAASELSVRRSSAASSGPIAPAIAKCRPARSSEPQPRSSRHQAAVTGASQHCTAPAPRHHSTAFAPPQRCTAPQGRCQASYRRCAAASMPQPGCILHACTPHDRSTAWLQRGLSATAPAPRLHSSTPRQHRCAARAWYCNIAYTLCGPLAACPLCAGYSHTACWAQKSPLLHCGCGYAAAAHHHARRLRPHRIAHARSRTS